LAATTISDEELLALDAIIGEMVDENVRKQKGEAADRRFHVAIARATRNTAITAVVENLWDMRYKSPLCVYMLDRARRVGVQPRIGEHRKILTALRRRDPKGARKAMRDHLARVIEGLLAATETDAIEGARTKAVKKRHEYTRRLAI
jgi:GntR family hexuronate regulon transcriptional repressor